MSTSLGSQPQPHRKDICQNSKVAREGLVFQVITLVIERVGLNYVLFIKSKHLFPTRSTVVRHIPKKVSIRSATKQPCLADNPYKELCK